MNECESNHIQGMGCHIDCGMRNRDKCHQYDEITAELLDLTQQEIDIRDSIIDDPGNKALWMEYSDFLFAEDPKIGEWVELQFCRNKTSLAFKKQKIASKIYSEICGDYKADYIIELFDSQWGGYD